MYILSLGVFPQTALRIWPFLGQFDQLIWILYFWEFFLKVKQLQVLWPLTLLDSRWYFLTKKSCLISDFINFDRSWWDLCPLVWLDYGLDILALRPCWLKYWLECDWELIQNLYCSQHWPKETRVSFFLFDLFTASPSRLLTSAVKGVTFV